MIPLPVGFEVKNEPCVGVSYIYYGRVIIQWLEDDDIGRRACWQWFGKNVWVND